MMLVFLKKSLLTTLIFCANLQMMGTNAVAVSSTNSRSQLSVTKLVWLSKVGVLSGSADLGKQVAIQTFQSFETVV